MSDEFFKIIGIIIIGGFIIYITSKSFNLQMKLMEGFVTGTTTAITGATTTTTNSSSSAGSAAGFAATIKSNVIQMQDSLLISKYRKDYENVILNMDDYVNYLMLQTLLKINTTNESSTNLDLFNSLNSLNSTKTSLNSLMKFVDSM